MSILHYSDTQCTAVLYSDGSLQMGQMAPKMTLGTLSMSGGFGGFGNFPKTLTHQGRSPQSCTHTAPEEPISEKYISTF